MAFLNFRSIHSEEIEGFMLNRREFLTITGASAAGAALGSAPRFAPVLAALPPAKADVTLRIAPVSVEIAPGTVIKTVGYNGKAPGPILRMREGKRITVDVHNDTDTPEQLHWHGQFVPSDVDGAAEEGVGQGVGLRGEAWARSAWCRCRCTHDPPR